MNHMLTPRMNLGVGAIKDMRDAVTGVTFNAIYAIGGYSGKAILGTAEKYEIQTDTWTEIAPMKTPRRNVGMWIFTGSVVAEINEVFEMSKDETFLIQSCSLIDSCCDGIIL